MMWSLRLQVYNSIALMHGHDCVQHSGCRTEQTPMGVESPSCSSWHVSSRNFIVTPAPDRSKVLFVTSQIILFKVLEAKYL